MSTNEPTHDRPAREGTDDLAESLQDDSPAETPDESRGQHPPDHDEDAETRAGAWADESPENYHSPEE